MLEIRGKRNSAICYAKVIEDAAIEQIQRMCDYELTDGSRIRIMPDVHAGAGCTIGTTMTVSEKVCPNVVGVDIGCGMFAAQLACKKLFFEMIDKVVHAIPSGMNVWDYPVEKFDLTRLKCYSYLRDPERLERSLGTLGGGNHFIEIDRASDGALWLVIHSGSRNLGKQVADYYQRLAVDLHSGKEEYFRRRDDIVRTYKAEGRRAEIQDALKALKREYENSRYNTPDDLCWLYDKPLNDYLHDVKICQQFAKRNRALMAKVILETAGIETVDWFESVHNYIDIDNMILRKGAISAQKGERVLIPLNMRDGSIIAVGKGNPEWNYSAPHGAGRIMSRAKAKKTLNVEAYKEAMKDIYTTSVNEQTIDEAPMVYKSLDAIIDVIGDTVDIVDIIKPVYNFKASE